MILGGCRGMRDEPGDGQCLISGQRWVERWQGIMMFNVLYLGKAEDLGIALLLLILLGILGFVR